MELLKGAPCHRPERVSPSAAVAPRPSASGGARDTVFFFLGHGAVAQGHRAGRPVRTANSASSPSKSFQTQTGGGLCWDPPRKDRNPLAHALNGNSAANGAGRKVVVPKLVDEAEDLKEVTALATANSQWFLEDADDNAVDPAASLVQMLGMERAEALSCLCARFHSRPPSEPRRLVLCLVSSCVFLLSESCRVTLDVQVASVENFEPQRKAIGAAPRR